MLLALCACTRFLRVQRKQSNCFVLKIWRPVLVIMAAAMPLHAQAVELNVSAASSLTDALKELAANYEKEAGDRIVFNFGASSLLARQIKEHAPADVFLSADEVQMDALQKDGLIAPETRRDLLSNTLVIIAPTQSSLTIDSLVDLATKAQKLAVADPRAVPAGIYTKQYLKACSGGPTSSSSRHFL